MTKSRNPPSEHIRASQIMGLNFFGLEHARQYFNVGPTVVDRQHLSKIPWGEKVLNDCRDTHILIAVPRVSISDLRKLTMVSGMTADIFDSGNRWYHYQPFVTSTEPGMRWYLIRKDAVVNPHSNEWNDQRKELYANDETMPDSQAVVYAMVSCFLAVGNRLFECVNVRCDNEDSDGNPIFIRFGQKGIHFFDWASDPHKEVFGLAAEKKPML